MQTVNRAAGPRHLDGVALGRQDQRSALNEIAHSKDTRGKDGTWWQRVEDGYVVASGGEEREHSHEHPSRTGTS